MKKSRSAERATHDREVLPTNEVDQPSTLHVRGARSLSCASHRRAPTWEVRSSPAVTAVQLPASAGGCCRSGCGFCELTAVTVTSTTFDPERGGSGHRIIKHVTYRDEKRHAQCRLPTTRDVHGRTLVPIRRDPPRSAGCRAAPKEKSTPAASCGRGRGKTLRGLLQAATAPRVPSVASMDMVLPARSTVSLRWSPGLR